MIDNPSTLTEENKLMLLISLINDNGKEKLIPSIEKLTNRVVSLSSTLSQEIVSYFTEAISLVPLKSEIYATVLLTLRSTHAELVLIILSKITGSLSQPQRSVLLNRQAYFP